MMTLLPSRCVALPLRACLLPLLGVLCSVSVQAAPNAASTSGITLQGTRVIYPGALKGGVSYTLTNNTNEVYLLQTRMLPLPPQVVQEANDMNEDSDNGPDIAGTSAVPAPDITVNALPMMVVPPLQRIEPGDKVSLRLRLVDSKALPTDRETVFLLSLKTIPTERDAASTKQVSDTLAAEGKTDVQLLMAVQTNLKVFYRPKALPEKSADQVSADLQMSRQGNTLVVKNPSAYYVTWAKLSVGTHDIDSTALWAMVPPFGEQRYTLPPGAQGTVQWQTFNDWGAVTDVKTRPL